jgi:site-specific DNA recombinase
MSSAAIYSRVSTESQGREGTSLQSQREACIAKGIELGYEIPGDLVYSEVWTGADTDRPMLNQIRDLIKKQTINALVCYSTDRLARNPIHIAIIAEECEKNNVALVFVTEPLDSSPEGQLIRYVKGFAGQVEREKIRERSMRGKKTACRLGKLATGGSPLFGYDSKDGKRAINEKQAKIVRMVFAMFVDESSKLYGAVVEMNRRGIQAPRGGIWSENTISRMVNNTAYMGEAYAFRYMVVEPKHPKVRKAYAKTTHIFRDRSEWIEVPNAVPPIVTREVFEATQEQLKRNRSKTPHNKRNFYLFSNGHLRCGICGHSMTGGVKKKPRGDRRYYRCISNVKSNYYHKCPQPSIGADKIESAVWQEISRLFSNPDMVANELQELSKQHIPATIEADRILIDTNIKEAKNEELRYLRQYGKGTISEDVLDGEIRRVKEYIAELQSRLSRLDAELKVAQETTQRYDAINNVARIISASIANTDNDTKRLTLEALNIVATIQPDGQINVKGAIPIEAHQLSQTHYRSVWYCLGRLHPP